jgi:hypothetical protein
MHASHAIYIAAGGRGKVDKVYLSSLVNFSLVNGAGGTFHPQNSNLRAINVTL